MTTPGRVRPGRLAARVRELLLSDAPDAERLVGMVQQAHGLPRDAARHVAARVVRALNAELFPPIRKMELILTEQCNLACSYCFERTMRGTRRMPAPVAVAAIDLLLDYSGEARDLEVVLFGGEPTLNFPVIERVTEHAERLAAARGKRIGLGMTSNGVHLTPAMLDFCAAHRIMILLSVDGLRDAHDRHRRDRGGRGSFGRVLAGLRRLKAVQPWVGVRMTVSPDTVESLYDDVRGLHELGVNQFIIGYATGVTWSEAAVRAFADASARLHAWYTSPRRSDLRIAEFDELPAPGAPARFGCQAARDTIAVSVTGELSPCSKMLALDTARLVMKLGDVFTGITHLRNRERLLACTPLRAACAGRGIAHDYHGGCFASNLTDTGSLFEPSLQDYRIVRLQREALREAAGRRPAS